MKDWFLEGHIHNLETMRKLRVSPTPFVIGRNPGLGLTIDSQNVSRCHAEIFKRGRCLFLKDLKSTNGTFVNHKPVGDPVTLKHGDIINISKIELRLSYEAVSEEMDNNTTHFDVGRTASNLPPGWVELEALFAGSLVRSDFQTIFDPRRAQAVAFEILGRGTHPKLPQSPIELIQIAETAESEIELVELMRIDGIKRAHDSASALPFFINIHPKELEDPKRLLQSIYLAKKDYPGPQLVLEIHERAVTNLAVMELLQTELKDMGVGMAYDDFGAGETRLIELAEMPPDYLKFDRALITGIDQAGARNEMVTLLVQLCKKMNIFSLAEGVSDALEAQACRDIGFDYVQGYFYGRPAPKPDAAFRKVG